MFIKFPATSIAENFRRYNEQIMDIKCFLLNKTDKRYQFLRRFCYSDKKLCPGSTYGHDAKMRIEDGMENDSTDALPHEDPRWPTKCEKCDYLFQPDDEWQLFCLTIWQRADNGEFCSTHPSVEPAPVGAMWNAYWMADLPSLSGPDGRSMVVKTPGGEWMIDSRASNCTMRDDQVHKCWVRHGEPPELTVDKNGKTCAAGGGSIQCGSYHGFLRNGHLTDC